MIGKQVRLTISDETGVFHTIAGVLVALASGPGQVPGPRQAAPWPCLVRILDADGKIGVISCDACELEFIDL